MAAERSHRVCRRAWHEKHHPWHAFRLVMESNVFYKREARTFALQDERQGELTPLEGATWVDWNQRGRLVYAKAGRLCASEIDERGVAEPKELASFNDNRPAPIEAPDWAKRW